MRANPTSAPLSNLSKKHGASGDEIFEFEYYGTPISVRYNRSRHFFEAGSPAFLPFKALTSSPLLADHETQFVDELLRQEAGLFYLPRGHGSMKQVADDAMVVSIFLEEESGVEIRDMYGNPLTFLIEPESLD